MDPKFTISALVFLPALSALVLAFVPLDSLLSSQPFWKKMLNLMIMR